MLDDVLEAADEKLSWRADEAMRQGHERGRECHREPSEELCQVTLALDAEGGPRRLTD